MDKFQAKYLTHEQILKITQEVVKAEQQTRGEIIPMIVARSSAIGHVPYYCFLLILSLILLTALGLEPWWFFEWKWWSLLASMVISGAVAWPLSLLPWIQRSLTSAKDQEAQVWQRAQTEWSQHKLQKTADRTGILIFVSVMERKAVVLADEGIARHYPQETWTEVVGILGSHLHRNEWVLGFQMAIAKCGDILKKHLPAGAKNPNEISDHLIIKN